MVYHKFAVCTLKKKHIWDYLSYLGVSSIFRHTLLMICVVCFLPGKLTHTAWSSVKNSVSPFFTHSSFGSLDGTAGSVFFLTKVGSSQLASGL